MTTLTIKINKSTKAGKAFMAMAETFFKDAEGIEIIETPDVKSTKKSKEKIPNDVTKRSMEKTMKGLDLTKTTSHKDLMEKLFS